MEVTKDFLIFKKAIIASIERPEFLQDDTELPTEKNLAYNGAYNILLLFSDGLSNKNLTKAKIRLIAKQIENVTNELDTFLDSRQLLLTWSFIGSEIDSWIELSLDKEYYESAANLKKIMEAYFNE